MPQPVRVKDLPIAVNVCQQALREVWKNSKQASLAHVIMEVGSTSLLHKHNTFTEVYYILGGQGTLIAGDKTIKVKADTVVEIPPSTPHKLSNTGKSKLSHLVVSSPAFNPDDVILLEETGDTP